MEGLSIGQLVDPAERFCPFGAVSSFPYRYMYGDETEAKAVAERFFDGGQFRSRGWHIFYLRSLENQDSKPVLFISKNEVEAFFKDIQEQTGIRARFPNSSKCPGFDLDFDLEGTPRPRYLGKFEGTTGLLELLENLPKEGSPFEDPINLEPRSLPAFRQRLQAAIHAAKSNNKQKKDKRKKARVLQKERWCSQLKRAQCYLGIRPRVPENVEEIWSDPNATWEESQVQQEAFEKASGIGLPLLDTNKPAPYTFYLNTVLVCIDIEVWEQDWSKLTEIGVSTLDTSDIQNILPGFQGENWMKLIRYRHFRVVEHHDKVNKRYVSGCPDKFMPEFGRSEWISVHEVPEVVAACLREPYSKPGLYQPYPFQMEKVPRHGSKFKPLVSPDPSKKRNLILVGHDFKSDIGYLRHAGYDVYNLSNVVEVVDSSDLYRAWKHDVNSTKLGNLLLELDRAGWHLHNAGNDAAYTLQAVIAMSIVTLDPANRAPLVPSEEKLAKAKDEEEQQLIVEKFEEWLVADEEGGDGGQPLPLERVEAEDSKIKAQKKEEAKARKQESNNQQPSKISQNDEQGPHLDPERRFGGFAPSESRHVQNQLQQQQRSGNTDRGSGRGVAHYRGQRGRERSTNGGNSYRHGRGRGRGQEQNGTQRLSNLQITEAPQQVNQRPVQMAMKPTFIIDDDAEYGA